MDDKKIDKVLLILLSVVFVIIVGIARFIWFLRGVETDVCDNSGFRGTADIYKEKGRIIDYVTQDFIQMVNGEKLNYTDKDCDGECMFIIKCTREKDLKRLVNNNGNRIWEGN